MGNTSILSIPMISGGGQNAVLDKLREEIFSTLHVGTICKVTAIDGSLLSIQPIIQERAVSNDGSVQWITLPVIPDVPYTCEKPNVNDYVVALFLDVDISGFINEYLSNARNTPAPIPQQILSYHSLSNAVCIGKINGLPSSVSYPKYGSITGSTANNGMGISDALIQFIESWEGFEANWYDDGTGTQTIGYGHTSETIPPEITLPLTQASGEQLLKSDLGSYISSVQSTFSGTTLTQNQFDAMVDFAFNMGPTALAGSTLAKDIKSGADFGTLKTDFEMWSKAGSQTLKGLLYRRDAEWSMFVNGQYLTNG